MTSRAELLALGYGESSRDGCPPCDSCHYVICRCSQYPDAASGRSAPVGYYEITRGVENAMVGVS
jgi:hypothetical protein